MEGSLPTTTVHVDVDTHDRQTSNRSRRNRGAPVPRPCRALQTTPLHNLLLPGEPCALDIEFQTFKNRDPQPGEKWQHRPGRLSLVNSTGDVVLDVFARYDYVEGVEKRYGRRFMIEREDLMLCNGAKKGAQVEAWVRDLVSDRVVVVHGGSHDRTAFREQTDVLAKADVVDTQKLYSHLQSDGTPGLATAAREVFGEDIQHGGIHSSVEDAQMTMRLYQKLHPFDREAALAKLPRYVQVGAQQSAGMVPRALQGNANKVVEPQAFAAAIDSVDDFPALGAGIKGRKRR